MKNSENEIEKNINVDISVLSSGDKDPRIHLGDEDEALKYYDDEIVIDEETDKRLLRKIDLYICPLMCILYACQFMDKNTNSSAAIMGLRTDLHMVANQYSWTGTAFYLGYLVFEFPSSTLLQRFPVVKTVSCFMVLWGIILCLHAIPKTYAGFLTLRVILGMLESAVTPAFVIITSQWYKKEEQFLRTSLWFASNGFGGLMGSSIAYGLYKRQNDYSIEAWRILYIVFGLYTIVLSVILYFHIPDVPSKAWFLTELERKQVTARIKGNQQGFGNIHFKKYQFIEAFKDPRTYLSFIEGIASNIPSGGLWTFGTIIYTEDFGYGTLKAFLMGMPGGAVMLVGCSLFGFSSLWVPHRMAIACFVLLIVEAAVCMFAFSTTKEVRLAGLYLVNLASTPLICLLSCFSANTAGHTKKITVNALYLIGYCIGNVIGPQTFRDSDAPHYKGAKVVIVVCFAISIVMVGMIYYLNWSDNKRRDREESRLVEELKLNNVQNIEFEDLTDFENPYFRYTL